MSTGLVATQMEVAFGGVRALNGVNISVPAGAIVGLIGRNGSGKSTLFNCVSGFVRPDAGRAFIDGVEITGLPPHRIVAKGMARTFQTPRIDPHATVLAAVLCGLYSVVRTSLFGALLGTPGAAREERELRSRAEAELERLGLAHLADVEIGTLSLGLVRLVDVARCLASGAGYILLDEPAAGLTQAEKDRLAQEIRSVAAGGVGVLIVEHNIELVRGLCQSISVLETGRVLCSGPPDQVLRNEEVVRSYLGALGEIDPATGGHA
jgi:ABC-type branched-subunit amino acid transport system ATPase component